MPKKHRMPEMAYSTKSQDGKRRVAPTPIDPSLIESPATVIVFDCETTGLNLHPSAELRKQPRMIEFGAVLLRVSDGEEIESASILINPGELLSAEITKITGLTDEDLRHAPTFAEALPAIEAMFSDAHAVIAHNLPFDRMILRNELARIKANSFPWPAVELCTVGLYRDLWGYQPKLTQLYETVIGKPLAQTHRALDDVRALVEVVKREDLWVML